MQVQENAHGNWESFPELSKEKVVEAFKCLQDINLKRIDEMLKDPYWVKEPSNEIE